MPWQGRTCALHGVRREVLRVEHRLVIWVRPGTGIEHPHETAQCRHAGDIRSSITDASVLLQCNRRWQSLDDVDIGYTDLVDQPTGIRCHRLQIAPLRFREQCPERQRGFPRAGHTGEHHQTVPRGTSRSTSARLFCRAPRTTDTLPPAIIGPRRDVRNGLSCR